MEEKYMLRAIELARQAALLGEVPVGCVVVRGGEIIGEGYNTRESGRDPLAHAEMLAIREASRAIGDWRLEDCSLYVTLEPCPMCAGAIINARVGEVVFGACDPSFGACGGVINLFEESFGFRPALYGGVLAEECAGLLKDFFKSLRG